MMFQESTVTFHCFEGHLCRARSHQAHRAGWIVFGAGVAGCTAVSCVRHRQSVERLRC